MNSASRSTAWSTDTRLLSRLLVYETAGQRKTSPDTSLRGRTLVLKANLTAGDDAAVSDYDLVGTSGISGHRTVLNDNPINAPERAINAPERVVEPPHGAMHPSDEDENMLPEGDTAEVLGAIAGLQSSNAPLMYAGDYEKALYYWFNSEAG